MNNLSGQLYIGASTRVHRVLPISFDKSGNQVEWIPCEIPSENPDMHVWLTLYKKDWSDFPAHFLDITDKSKWNWNFNLSGNGEAYVFESKFDNLSNKQDYLGFISLSYNSSQTQTGVVMFTEANPPCPVLVLGNSPQGAYIEAMMIRGAGNILGEGISSNFGIIKAHCEKHTLSLSKGVNSIPLNYSFSGNRIIGATVTYGGYIGSQAMIANDGNYHSDYGLSYIIKKDKKMLEIYASSSYVERDLDIVIFYI